MHFFSQPSSASIFAWGPLFKSFRQKIPEGVAHYGKEVIDATQSNDEVTVTCSDQSQYKCDLLIGADGVNSKIRSLIFPNHQLEYSGCVLWRGNVSPDIFGDEPFPYPDTFTNMKPEGKKGNVAFFTSKDPTTPGKLVIAWASYLPLTPEELADARNGANGIKYQNFVPPGCLRPEVEKKFKDYFAPAVPEYQRKFLLETSNTSVEVRIHFLDFL